MPNQDDNNGITLIIDGNSAAYRAFFKAPPLTNGSMPTGAIHIFLTILEKLSDTPGVVKVIAVFDAPGKNKRYDILPDYKANRDKMPEDLSLQIDALKTIIPLMGIPLYCVSGYEADDVIYTLTKNIKNNIYIVTKDKDLHQLINERIKIYDYQTETLIGRNEAKEKFGVYPEKICDLLSLSGDTSDNIPGIAGVGLKTAASLLETYDNIDNIYNNIDNIKGKLKDKLILGKDSCYKSRELVRLLYIEDLEEPLFNPDEEELKKIYEKYSLTSHLKRLAKGEVPHIEKNEEKEAPPLLCGSVENPELIAFCNGKVYRAGGGFYEENPSPLPLSLAYDIKSLLKAGFSLNGGAFDLMIASWLINPDSGGLKIKKDEEIPLFLSRLISCEKDIKEGVKKLGLEDLYYKTELPLSAIIADMEKTGIYIKKDIIISAAGALRNEALSLRAKICEEAGLNININSPKQLSSYLYDTLALKPPKKNKSGYSTDEDTIKELRSLYPEYKNILNSILKYREINKLLSTYTENLLEFCGNDGRIHSEFKQTGTATGRFSSINPNMQNIPQRGAFAKQLRSAFRAREGYSFISFDYSQIELRILAHLSEDPALLRSYANNEDIHTLTAKAIFHIPESEEISPETRRIAKAVNFGIIYGLSAFGLARDVEVPPSEAKLFIDRYFNLYKNVRSFINKTISETRANGYCETILGRKRFISDISSRNANIRQRAERMAINAPIQGSAADIIKIAMIDCDKYIKENKIDASLVLQVHDELIYEVSEKISDVFIKNISYIMENVYKMKVPLLVNSSIGNNLGEL